MIHSGIHPDGENDTGPGARTRADLCPGVLRPWPADDGALVRIRLVGGRLTGRALAGLSELAVRYGDGRLHLTTRANLQLRGLPTTDRTTNPTTHPTRRYAAGGLPEPLVAAIEGLGVLPSRAHDRVRNIMLSPQTGLAGGRADLRPLAAALDAGIRADERLAGLPAKFLVVIDDGRGDLVQRTADLGLVALSEAEGQLRVGGHWSDVVRLEEAVPRLLDLAVRFLDRRGSGPDAAWHVDELPEPLVAPGPPDDRLPRPAGPLPDGPVPGGHHVVAPDGRLSPALVADLVAALPAPDDVVVVTPWRGVLIPQGAR